MNTQALLKNRISKKICESKHIPFFMEPRIIFFSSSRMDAEYSTGQEPGWGDWKALKASKYTHFVASEKSVVFLNALIEIYYAVDESNTVLPVIIHNCSIPFRTSRF